MMRLARKGISVLLWLYCQPVVVQCYPLPGLAHYIHDQKCQLTAYCCSALVSGQLKPTDYLTQHELAYELVLITVA